MVTRELTNRIRAILSDSSMWSSNHSEYWGIVQPATYAYDMTCIYVLQRITLRIFLENSRRILCNSYSSGIFLKNSQCNSLQHTHIQTYTHTYTQINIKIFWRLQQFFKKILAQVKRKDITLILIFTKHCLHVITLTLKIFSWPYADWSSITKILQRLSMAQPFWQNKKLPVERDFLWWCSWDMLAVMSISIKVHIWESFSSEHFTLVFVC